MYVPSSLWLDGTAGRRPQPTASNASTTRAATSQSRRPATARTSLARVVADEPWPTSHDILMRQELNMRSRRFHLSYPPAASASVLVSVNTGLGFGVPPSTGHAGTLYTAIDTAVAQSPNGVQVIVPLKPL